MGTVFEVIAHSQTGQIEFGEGAHNAAVRFDTHRQEVPGAEAGQALWHCMMSGGVSPQTLPIVIIREGSGVPVATLHPVLQGAQAVWLMLYRANRDGTCFRNLGSKHRIGDALGTVFHEVQKEVRIPHKP